MEESRSKFVRHVDRFSGFESHIFNAPVARPSGGANSPVGTEEVKRVLLIAFHYPPAKGSSGIQRTLSYSRYLRECGWEATVLTANRRAYPDRSDSQLADIPCDVSVKRAFALDTARHLALRGRYIGAFAYPDRWVTWWIGAVGSALRMIRDYKPDVIWSTYPIATAHLIGLTVHHITSIPWIADFRDSMTEDAYPADERRRKIYRWIECRTVANAAYSVFTAPGAVRMYASRYPEIDQNRWKCLLNGYDDQVFNNSEATVQFQGTHTRKTVLLHSGILYPSERDPTAFFAAVKQLKASRSNDYENLEIRLRATGFDSELEAQIAEFGIGDIIKVLPAISYAEAIGEMLQADGLLIFQASNCNHQIPAKIYEYIRARRPILALTDPLGDTATLLRQSGISTISPLDSQSEIFAALEYFLSMIEANSAPLASDETILRFSRRSQTRELAQLFNSLTT